MLFASADFTFFVFADVLPEGCEITARIEHGDWKFEKRGGLGGKPHGSESVLHHLREPFARDDKGGDSEFLGLCGSPTGRRGAAPSTRVASNYRFTSLFFDHAGDIVEIFALRPRSDHFIVGNNLRRGKTLLELFSDQGKCPIGLPDRI